MPGPPTTEPGNRRQPAAITLRTAGRSPTALSQRSVDGVSPSAPLESAFTRASHPAVEQKRRDVGHRVLASEELDLGQALLLHLEHAHAVGGEALDGGGHPLRRIHKVVQLRQRPTQAAGAPDQPGQRVGPRDRFVGQQATRRFRQVDQDGGGLEHRHWACRCVVNDRRNLVVRRNPEERRRKLFAPGDVDRAHRVLGAGLLQHDLRLAAVGTWVGVEVDHGRLFTRPPSWHRSVRSCSRPDPAGRPGAACRSSSDPPRG